MPTASAQPPVFLAEYDWQFIWPMEGQPEPHKPRLWNILFFLIVGGVKQ